MRLRSWIALLAFVPAIAAAMACDSQAPPTLPLPRPPSPPGSPNLRIEGLAIDADTEQPIADANITTIAVGGRAMSLPTSTTAGSDGRFVLMAYVAAWSNLMLEVAGTGYETAYINTNPTPGSATTLRAYRTMSIQPGQSIDLRVFLEYYFCGSDDFPCRRFVVDAPDGELVDLEVIPADSRDRFSLAIGAGDPGWRASGSQPRMTVAAGPVWVYGGSYPPTPGRLTLVATRR